MSVDPAILNAWASGRSIARGLAPPRPEYGGLRIDTNSDVEVRRWIFPQLGAGIGELARSISEPRYFLKLCGEADELRSVLPSAWSFHPPSYFMRASRAHMERPLAAGYRIETRRVGRVVEVGVFSEADMLAASGYGVETEDAFVYDRIVTNEEHRRQGLGHAVMAALQRQKISPTVPELLVATEQGCALYASLGWQVISPYSTASIAVPEA
ncbi:GNAT family N-acetyltransferase [Rhizobium lusitanum]|uniref:GNAT superfamily N-acetyltransferase n=1 Tax=Rhizobium lusitanum TaxID=293958 RepID=A0A7X0IS76_9HYPH|nr:GNAT family N-acetyltransferase [Rhizobium lusitanum]MBB6486195.1 GNAT superfamily N-acetyltransferase [Rhizobium lusitanum]